VPVAVGVLAVLVLTGGIFWAVTRQEDGPRYPLGPTTTTTTPRPDEYSSGLDKLAATTFKLDYRRQDANGEKVVTGSVDPTTSSAAFSTGDQQILVVGGSRFEQVPASMSGQLPAGVAWIRRTTPVDSLDLAQLFPVEVPTPQGAQNLLTYPKLPGQPIDAPTGSTRYQLVLDGVTNTDPPAAAAAWQLDGSGVLQQMEAAVSSDAGEIRTSLAVSEVGVPPQITAPRAETVIDEAALPPALASLLSQ
jgi:hypothetical protein